METQLLKIVKNFKIKGNKIVSIEPYGEGHINSTYKVETESNKYILQKINNHIFKDVDGLMNNIHLVTSSLRSQLPESEDEDVRETMVIIKTNNNKLYYHDLDTDSYFRMYVFVKDSLTFQNCETKEDFKKSAEGFSNFTKQLQSFDASKLCEVIPNFHNTEKRFEHFLQTLKEDKLDRAKLCKDEIDFVLKRKEDCSIAVNLIKEGRIPLRVTHNDTKLNNILFDSKTKEPLCVIDLDTIMPGSTLYDFGDSIRFGCNPAGESEKDLTKVIFRKDFFIAFAEGYLKNLKDVLTKDEIDHLAFGAKLMTLECGIRFLDDFLDGDNYFRIHFEDENLVRCRTQFALVKQMEDQMDDLNKIVKSI